MWSVCEGRALCRLDIAGVDAEEDEADLVMANPLMVSRPKASRKEARAATASSNGRKAARVDMEVMAAKATRAAIRA